MHTFAEGYSVVWWDPTPGGGLNLDRKAPFGVRREELIVKDVAKNVVADGRSQYDRWRLSRIDAVAAGSIPSIQLETVGQWSRRPDLPLGRPGDVDHGNTRRPDLQVGRLGEVGHADSRRPDLQVGRVDVGRPDAVEILTVPAAPEAVARRGGRAFGVLVHTILAQTPFDATRSVLEAIGEVESRVLGLTEDDVVAAAATVERVLRHDLLVRAHAASKRGACRRETPITLMLPDGTLVEGVVDLAFEEQGAWTVVDYKTDRELDDGEESYRRQVALYAAGITAATRQVARGILIRV